MPAGQPKYYKTAKEMQKAIDAYFKSVGEGELTITGLAMALGFTSRQALINYEGYSPEFFDTIKKAKMRVENDYEKALRKTGKAGDIFGLKNFGWKDTVSVEGELNHKILRVEGLESLGPI